MSLPVRPQWPLVALSLSTLMPSLDSSIANAGLPSMAMAFNASFRDVQWIVVAYLLAVTSLIVSAGRLGDLFGRRRLLVTGIAIFTAASLACGLAPTLSSLIAARTAQGLGAALMLALSVAFVGDTAVTSTAGRAMGLLGTMSAAGTAIGPSLGGLLIAGFGWRAIFLVNIPAGVLTLILAYRALPADQPASRVSSPIIPLALFRDPVLTGGLVMSVLVSAVMMTTLIVGPFYLSGALGLAAAAVGFALSAGPLVAALSGVPAGRLVDRHGAERLTLVGLGGIALAAALLSVLPPRLGVPGYLAPIVLMTASYALFQASNNTAIMSAAPADQRGAAAGLIGLARNLGLITGASLMGTVFAIASASAAAMASRPASIVRGTRLTFAVAALLVLAAFAVGTRARTLALTRSR